MIFISNKKEKKKKNLPLVRKTYEETKTRSEHNLLNSFFFLFFSSKKSQLDGRQHIMKMQQLM